MNELISVQHFETAQDQRPLEPAIVSYCEKFSNPNTRMSYRGDLRHFSNFAIGVGVSQIGQISPRIIDRYLRHCKDSRLSRATLRRRVGSLSGLLAKEGKEHLAETTKRAGYNRTGSAKEIKPFYPLNSLEVKKLQEVSRDNSRNAAFIEIALGTGANVSEILALRTGNIVEDDGYVIVRFGKEEHIKLNKLSPDASVIVTKHKEKREKEDLLFAEEQLGGKEGISLSRQMVFVILKEYGKRIGRPDLNSKVLRQTFIANMQTNNPKELAELLGIDSDNSIRLLERRRVTERLFPQSGLLFERTA